MSYSLEEISLMQIKEEQSEANWSRFVIEPLSPGFGLTIGNALRRVLLSSIEGVAITSFRIDGVSHEFTTIKGVHQDVVDIILNLKRVRLSYQGTEPQVIILDAKKAGIVKAGDFKCPTGVEVINKDHVICELSEGGKLLLEATIEHGRGYVATESRKEEKLPIGVIAIDSAYSPINKVNFQIENTRVGKMTNFDKLILEIGTDGAITPQEALSIASGILVDHFQVISGPKKVAAPTEEIETAEMTEVKEVKAPKAAKAEKVTKEDKPKKTKK